LLVDHLAAMNFAIDRGPLECSETRATLCTLSTIAVSSGTPAWRPVRRLAVVASTTVAVATVENRLGY
jgi:hypothetical protein